ncbi:helix-turn-helix domain-containing protein [Actinomadura parmotrematis]|uniref:Tetratricopeptide repeat protein n=1 Tax=Actinomadura parmotrematis TaxID=2864039 RepID=A0ABS7FMF0_9ACTN|nr:helix-turn-helix transcriptional regulator [Actinomadura parmotrematis]MBW8480762.1 tetratricopeptide repeat protein [Actinomadura parmotrematis]
MDRETLGQRIRALRIRQGISQAQLAFPELSDSYISLIESDKRVPAPSVIDLLAGKLSCSATYLVSGVSEDVVDELRVTLDYAEIALRNGAAAEARTRFAEVLASADAVALPDMLHQARWGHALALEAAGGLEEAIGELRTLTAEASAEADLDHWARVHIALSRCLRERGDATAGVQVAEEAQRHLVATGADSTEAAVRLGAALLGAFVERGDLVRARQLAAQVVERAERVGTASARVVAYWQAAAVAEVRGEYDEGVALIERALLLAGELPDPRELNRLRVSYAGLLLRAHPDQAAHALDLLGRVRAESAAQAAGEIDTALCLTELARAETALGRPGEAVALAEEALDLLGDAPRRAAASALTVLGEAHVRLGHRNRAVEALTGAATHLERMESAREAAQTWFDLAELLAETGGQEDSRLAAYQRALTCAGV